MIPKYMYICARVVQKVPGHLQFILKKDAIFRKVLYYFNIENNKVYLYKSEQCTSLKWSRSPWFSWKWYASFSVWPDGTIARSIGKSLCHFRWVILNELCFSCFIYHLFRFCQRLTQVDKNMSLKTPEEIS